VATDASVVARTPERVVSGSPAEVSGRPRIVVLLPRGEAIRNFVYSGMLRELRREAEITLLSVVPSDDLRDLMEKEAGGLTELKPVATRRPVGFLFDLVEMAHGRRLWSEAAKERWRLRDFKAQVPVARAKRGIKKVLCRPFANRRGVELLTTVQGLASRWLRTTDEYVDLLRQIRPALVFNGSHVHSRLAEPVVEAARWLGIRTVAFIFSWDNLTSQGRILPPHDRYLVWNESLRQQLLRIYDRVDPGHVYVTGTPQFDFHLRPEFRMDRQAFCRQVGADPARPIVLYTTGMAYHMPGEPIIVERIADMLRGMTDLGPPQLLVRVYAKDRTGRFDELKRRRKDLLFPRIFWEPAYLTPRPEDGPLLTNMLLHAAVGINVASTVSLELCMFDKPVINVGYNPPGVESVPVDFIRYYDYDHYRPVVESGAVAVAKSEADLDAMVREALVDPGRSSAARHALLRTFFGSTLDGRSAERVAHRLLAIASAEGEHGESPTR
jgi:hypothetical protein